MRNNSTKSSNYASVAMIKHTYEGHDHLENKEDRIKQVEAFTER
jgi:hypothetical protein